MCKLINIILLQRYEKKNEFYFRKEMETISRDKYKPCVFHRRAQLLMSVFVTFSNSNGLAIIGNNGGNRLKL